MLLSGPALATGAILGSGLIVTVTLSFPFAPRLSVTTSSKMYCPCKTKLTAVIMAVESAINTVAGPLIFLHW